MELSALYLKAGLKNVGVMFLVTDAQIPDESFLVLINDLLATGEVTDLFPDDEVENIITSVRNEVNTNFVFESRVLVVIRGLIGERSGHRGYTRKLLEILRGSSPTTVESGFVFLAGRFDLADTVA